MLETMVKEQVASEETLVSQFDHLAPNLGPDGTCTAHYIALRNEAQRDGRPIGWSKKHGGFWVVMGYAEATAIWRNNVDFSNTGITFPAYGVTEPIMLVGQDEPEHKRARALVVEPFGPKRACIFDTLIRESVNELIDGFIETGETDIVLSLGQTIPTALTTAMLGVSPADGPQLHAWTHALTHYAKDPEGTRDQIAALYAYIDRTVAERQANPGTDILSRIVTSQIAGNSLDTDELRGFCTALLLGGIDNTSMLIGNLFWRLAWDSDLRDGLVADPRGIPAVIEELMRFYSPSISGRLVVKEVEIGGVTMKPGHQVMLVSGVANRDPAVFPYPDVFIPQRKPNPHLSLATGPHHCLGRNVAQVELRALLEEFLKRLPNFWLAQETPPKWITGQVQGMASVTIHFEPQKSLNGSSGPLVTAWREFRDRHPA